MAALTPHVAFGPPGRRIVNLAASPNGRYLAFQHVPQNYSTDDYHYLFFRQAGDTYLAVGELPEPPPKGPGYSGSMQRHGFAPLDDGSCLSLETGDGRVQLARSTPAAHGISEAARWAIDGTLSLNNATLHLLPSGREALVLVTDQDDKQVDWGGGPPPDYIQTWHRVDVATGAKIESDSHVQLSEPPISLHDFASSRGVSVLVALGAPSWVGTRDRRECATLQEIIRPLAWKALESAIHAGRTRLLTSQRVIEIASGETSLRIPEDAASVRFEAGPRFHDLSPDGNYALSTVKDGHFALWNIDYQTPWQPTLPEHGGVHCAIFLPGGRAALGTKAGGVIVVDCAAGLVPGDTPW